MRGADDGRRIDRGYAELRVSGDLLTFIRPGTMGFMLTGPRKWRRRGLIAFGIYVAVMVVASFFADKLILFPSRQPIAAAGATRLEVAGPAGAIEIWREPTVTRQLRPDRPGEGYVLAFIGNGSRAEYDVGSAANRWREHNVEVWAVNYPGYGGSAGTARLANIAPAALAAYDELARQAAGAPIYLSADSIGSTAALYVAANRPAAGLFMRNPPPLRQLILGRHGWWNLWITAALVYPRIPAELDSIANASRVHCPAVFMLCEADEVVPMSYKQRIVDAFAGEKRVIDIPGAGHNDDLPPSRDGESLDAVTWLIQHAAVAKD